MAARRLLILMLVLLGLSTLAAALVDPTIRQGRSGTTTATGTEATEPGASTQADPGAATATGAAAAEGASGGDRAAGGPAGKRLGATIEIGRDVKVIPIATGDQLSLRVKWDRPGLVEIPALGLLEPVAPGAPARFDVLASEPVSYGVRLLDPGRLVARIEVKARAKGASGGSRRPSKPAR